MNSYKAIITETPETKEGTIIEDNRTSIVYDLRNLKFKAVYSLPPEKAVICAYAQYEKGDFNTWNYQEKYSHLLKDAKHFVSCGDYTSKKEADQ